MTQNKIFLKDYTPPAFLIENVDLTFHLDPQKTRVISKIKFYPNPAATDQTFFLHGQGVKLISAQIDGVEITPTVSDAGLTYPAPNRPFEWQAEVEINPQANTALSGLYMSNGMYCTQCEAEGFRRITFYPDRPDVMAPFRVRVHGDYPVLLSNGNKAGNGAGWAEWDDPWPKPAYLFALVAGDLLARSGRFTTMEGRDVELNVYVCEGDGDKCDFALKALKESMKWDEDVYWRAYDLDIFNIVAVDDFNMGAMENKGLNIFNSAAVLATPETATDADFERVEAIIAHEYFHNWTGNRITCRDWFQLSLKEGLTVFRDQQFSADIRSAPVRRIEDVKMLRSRQFREDNGPLTHPVQPDSFVEINNFYTATIYEKGAEVIRMLRHIVGADGYKKALDLYFTRHDGQACTIQDWLQVFEDATGADLSQFKLWYSQAGTPVVKVDEAFGKDGIYHLTLSQHTPDTPEQSGKNPVVIPIHLGLIAPTGEEVLKTQQIVLSQAQQKINFGPFDEKPTLSILRGFSAPVKIIQKQDMEQKLCLFAHDSDEFNRWEAGRDLARSAIIDLALQKTAPDEGFIAAFIDTFNNNALDPAFRALCAQLPGQDEIAQSIYEMGHTPDPHAIYAAQKQLYLMIAQAGSDVFANIYENHQITQPYSPDAGQCGQRAIANAALSYINRLDGGERAFAQLKSARTMTLKLPALAGVIDTQYGPQAISDFYYEWAHERLVINKWFAAQIVNAAPKDGVSTVKNLLQHPDYTLKNPNRVRSVLGALAGTPTAFHAENGAGYTLFADEVIKIDALNPQLAARLCGAFETYRRYSNARQDQMAAAMQCIMDQPNISRDTAEMLGRLLQA